MSQQNRGVPALGLCSQASHVSGHHGEAPRHRHKEGNSVFFQGQGPPIPEVQRRDEAGCWQGGLGFSPGYLNLP